MCGLWPAFYFMTAKKNDRGYALIMTIWIMVFLIITALNFTLSNRFSIAMVRNFKEQSEGYYIAMAGYHTVLNYLKSDKDPAVDFIDEKGRFHIDTETEPLPEVIRVSGGEFRVKIIDEEGKININYVNELILREVFKNLGMEADRIDEMVDSLKDWIDFDDLHRLKGAEDDYYEEYGYTAKNGRIDVIGELALINGFGEDFLKRADDGNTVLPAFTTFGTGNININTASAQVLRLLGLNEIDIETIMRQRTETIGGYRAIPAQYTSKGLKKTWSAYFTIEIEGRKRGSNISYNIRSVVKRVKSPKGFKIETLYWSEDVSYNSH
ncbi:MAG: hypothetical protein D6710_04600 [Nitrospirae bacterium]|nr:MAG: hypothetical protein D6710_04600 [Nitrospirota bacterium]